MKPVLPKIITFAFYAQIVLLVASLLVLWLTSGFDGLFAVFTLVPMVALAPIIAWLGVFFPYKEWKQYGSWVIAAALLINTLASLGLFIRFVVLSFLLHVR